MRAQFVLSEIGIGLRRNLTMTIAVIVSVALSLALAGGSLLVRDQVNSMKGYWYDKVEVSISFCTKFDGAASAQCASGAATADQVTAVKAQLDKMKPLVQQATLESSSEAYKHWKESNPDNPLLAAVGPEAMPQSSADRNFARDMYLPRRMPSTSNTPTLTCVSPRSETIARASAAVLTLRGSMR